MSTKFCAVYKFLFGNFLIYRAEQKERGKNEKHAVKTKKNASGAKIRPARARFPLNG